MNPESKIQIKVIKFLEKDGWYVLRLISTNKTGIPDLLAFKKNEPDIFIEVKTETGKLSKLQEFRHKDIIKKTGAIVITHYGYKDFILKFNNLL